MSIPCPQCLGELRVQRGMTTNEGFVRYKKCMLCKRTTKTIEKVMAGEQKEIFNEKIKLLNEKVKELSGKLEMVCSLAGGNNQ